MKTLTEKEKKHRGFLVALPIITLPFLTLGFWALGGGSQAHAEITEVHQGLNRELPDAQLSDGPLDKMSMYHQSDRDSMEKTQQGLIAGDEVGSKDTPGTMSAFEGYPSGNGTVNGYQGITDPNEQKVAQRLERLERSLSQPAPATGYAPQNSYGQQSSPMAGDLDRLERMMEAMGQGGKDPEMAQLDGMLEKLMDLQQPDRARLKLMEQSRLAKGRTFTVSRAGAEKRTSLIGPSPGQKDRNAITAQANRFYPLDEGRQTDQQISMAISAVVHETQILVSGGRVKMRLLDDIMVSGILIPSGQFIYGKAAINGERLTVEVASITYKKAVLPVSLIVYDMDAMEGIRIPGAINREAAKDGADRALQNVQLMSLDPSLAGQAAGTGVEIAKGLFSKKAKLIRATLKADHPIMLVDQKQLQELQ